MQRKSSTFTIYNQQRNNLTNNNMLALLIQLLIFTLTFTSLHSHSMMSWPQGISPKVCRMGGDPNPQTCRGPCDLTAINGRFANHASPADPAGVYRRGQRITIKYQRNNHGPGGFVRHTLVPVDEMMDKDAHSRNAFHYSCFGAHPVRATRADLQPDRWGYTIAGNDGKKAPPGYYETKVTIPDVIPDGDYVLGWVWYGGTGGPVSNGEYTQEPFNKGYFGDYWSCSFVRIEGGNPVTDSFVPEFVNDMRKFSSVGCMSANDAPGICVHEPCIVEWGDYQMPKPFKSGAPPALTPQHFDRNYRGDASPASDRSSGAPAGTEEQPVIVEPEPEPEPEPEEVVVEEEEEDEMDSDPNTSAERGACRCIGKGSRCGRRVARRSGNLCTRRTKAHKQSRECKDTCCEYCRSGYDGTERVCQYRNVRRVCGL